MAEIAQQGSAHRLRQAASTAGRLEGRLASFDERREVVRKEVADAKGRLAAKDEIKAVLEEMQNEAYGKVRKDYEDILTGLVKDILPQSPAIALDLYTHRGQPALDILTRKQDGSFGNVYKDHGGALVNVVSAGMRLLAVLSTRGARFVVLDEPDCWIKTDLVASFYAVMEDAASQLGLQCFLISHHPIEDFETNIRVSKVAGHPDTGVTIVSDARDPVWEDEDRPGFRYVRLENFQSYKRAEILLTPGVNAIGGMHDMGKTAVVRAFQAAFYGDTWDSQIRTGETHYTIEFGWSKGRFLRFRRNLKSGVNQPKNIWSLHERDGSVVVENGITHLDDKKGQTTPEWVDRIFGIARMNDIDVHLPSQLSPTFLLDEGPSVRASILSIGREADYVPDMMSRHKDMVTADGKIAREGEKEFSEIEKSIARLEPVKAISATISILTDTATTLQASVETLRGDEALTGTHRDLASRLQADTHRAECFQDLPDDEYPVELREALTWWMDAAEDFDDSVAASRRSHRAERLLGHLADLPAKAPTLHPVGEDASTLSSYVASLRAMKRSSNLTEALGILSERGPTINAVENDEKLLRAYEACLARLDSSKLRLSHLSTDGVPVPVQVDVRDMEDMLRLYQTDMQALRTSQEAVDQLEDELRIVEDDLATLVEEGGNRCPTCGQHADVGHFIGSHDSTMEVRP